MNRLANKKLLHVALCGILSGALVACKSDKNDKNETVFTDRDWQPVACSAEFTMDLLTGLDVEDDIDGLVIYQGGGQLAPFAKVVGGTPCSNALDVDYCQSLLDQSIADHDSEISTLIVTSGDEVRAIQGKDDVLAFLGVLDTREKVFLWMHVNNIGLSCSVEQSAVARAEDWEGWYGLYTEITSDCAPVTTDRVEIGIGIDGAINELSRVQISNSTDLCIGRVPPGVMRIVAGDECVNIQNIGNMFAQNAAYEAASVVAFTHLKSELEYYGAPQSILDKLQEAANDEHRHAEQVGDLAKKFGAVADGFELEASPIRSLEEIALDNLVEGCVGETWGALIGLYQAENAQDETIRNTMQAVALDEVGHAALSWEIHEWLVAQLDEAGRQKVKLAAGQALVQLKARAEKSSREAYELYAGLPTSSASRQLISQLSELLEAQVKHVS